MNQKISLLTPEPIRLVEEDVAEDITNSDDDSGSSFQRVYVGDCTIVNSENGSKFAVWKVTMVLQNYVDKSTLNPRIVTYMRYSDFVHFRDALIQNVPSRLVEIPDLPPTVKWYESWRYQDVNLNKKWLAKRRQGLEFFLNHVLLNRDLFVIAKKLILDYIDKRTFQDP